MPKQMHAINDYANQSLIRALYCMSFKVVKHAEDAVHAPRNGSSSERQAAHSNYPNRDITRESYWIDFVVRGKLS